MSGQRRERSDSASAALSPEEAERQRKLLEHQQALIVTAAHPRRNTLRSTPASVFNDIDSTAPSSTNSASVASNSSSSADDGAMSVNDFDVGQKLGKGSYSKVYLCTLKTDKSQKFAVKVIHKELLIRYRKMATVKNERDALMMLKGHPNIISLHSTFQDQDNLYFVMEFAPNGALTQLMQKLGPSTIEVARFYTAEIVHALAFMHSKKILHRDVKPDNILLDESMHIKFTDFGTAKIGTQTDEESDESEPDRQMRHKGTFVGTAAYVSPEVLNNQPASEVSDLWAVGCMLYQFLIGQPPFKGESEYIIFQKILTLAVDMPSRIPQSARDLIMRLLKINPIERIGYNGYDEIRNHPFFEGIDWANISNTTPPSVPSSPVSSSSSSSSFPRVQSRRPGPHPSANRSSGKQPGISSLFRTPSSRIDFDDVSVSRTPTLDDESTRARTQLEERMFEQYLAKGEVILHSSMVLKKRFMQAKKRNLVLTNAPRLFYIDPETVNLKGEILLSPEAVRVELRSSKMFVVNTPGRSYNFETSDPGKWVKMIGQARKKS